MLADGRWSVCGNAPELTRSKPKKKKEFLRPPHDLLHTEPPVGYSSINLESLECTKIQKRVQYCWGIQLKCMLCC